MKKHTKCVISFASKGRENYNRALERNIHETQKHFTGDFLYYSLDEGGRAFEGQTINAGLPKGCPSHQDVPYGFKPWLFKEAYDKGYRKILWMDSTIVPMRNFNDVFDHASKYGVVAFNNLGHPLAKWISDVAVKNTGVDLRKNPYQIMACVVGFDLDNPKGKEIFDEWMGFAQDGQSFQNNPGSFPGFMAHRHDQAILSAILWNRKTPLLQYGNLVYESHPDGYEGRTMYFMNKGVGQ